MSTTELQSQATQSPATQPAEALPAVPAAQRYTHPQAVLWVVCLIGLISVAGIALPYPVLAPLFGSSTLNDFNHWQQIPPSILLGIALAANPLGMLIGSASLGALSDLYGRRRILALALGLAIIGYLCSALSLWLACYPAFVLSRFLTGLCEGSVSICRAIAADLHPQIDRSKGISWMNSALYAAWLVGPLVGGATMHLGDAVPFLIAALAMLPCLLLLGWLLPADAVSAVATAGGAAATQSVWQALRQHNSLRLLAVPALQLMALAQLTYTLGLNAFYEFYPLWLVEQHGFTGWDIGLITALLCALMTLVSAVGMARFSQRVQPLRGAMLAVSCYGLMLAVLPLTSGGWVWCWLVLCGVPNAMFSAWFQVYVTARHGELGLGRVMGLLTLLMCLGNVVIALIGGVLAQWGSQWVLWAGAGLMLLAGAQLSFLLYQQRKLSHYAADLPG